MLEHNQMAGLINRENDELFAMADTSRFTHCGDEVHLRGIVEFSNVCSRNCLYCGLRRDNSALPRYTMSTDEILFVVSNADRNGVRTIVLQSGENDDEQAGRLASTISAIKKEFDVAVTLCVGVKSSDCFRQWRQAGADRYLLKHETAAQALYEKLHPDSDLNGRLSTLGSLRALGYQIGSGCIIGLPTQTPGDLADDILLTRRLDIDMAAFGPFVPHPSTPLAAAPAGDIDVSLRFVAAARLALGPVHIPATTAFDAIAPDGRERALRCGANVIMANITPDRYRRLYTIYPSDRAANSVDRVKAILNRTERPLARDRGDSLKRREETKTCNVLQRV